MVLFGPDRRRRELAGYTVLFALMIAWVIAIPLLGGTELGRGLLLLVYLGMMVLALDISLPPSWPRWWPWLALAALILPRLLLPPDASWALIAEHAADMVVGVLVPLLLTAHVLRTADVTANTIFGALLAYGFMGLGWAQVFMAIEALVPGSFSFPTEGPHDTFEFLYFSFISLTTVGYGDITPRMPAARSFAMLEGLLGQIYMAVLVARLVGLHASRPAASRGSSHPE
jgi:hypothetical protein